MKPALTLRALSFALMTLTVFAWAHEPGGEEHSEGILAHLRHRLDSNDPQLDLEGSVWRIRADFRGYYDSTNTEIISLWFDDWDYTEEHGWNIDLGGDHEWLIIPSSPPSLPVMMHAYAGYNYGLTEATHFPHLYMGNIMNVYEVQPYVIPLSGETRAPGYATLTGWIHNYNDEGEYDDIWIPGPEPGQGHWDENPLHADSSVSRSMTIEFSSIQESVQYFPKSSELTVNPRPEPWPDQYTWTFAGLADPFTTTTPALQPQCYEPIMDNLTPPLRGSHVTVTAEGNVVANLSGSQQQPTGTAYRLTDTTQIELFSVVITPAAAFTPNVESIPSGNKILWYIGLPLHLQANIYPAVLENDYIDDVVWHDASQLLCNVHEAQPANKYRHRTWWSEQVASVSADLTIQGRTAYATRQISVADWFIYSCQRAAEQGLAVFNFGNIGVNASQIVNSQGWLSTYLVLENFCGDPNCPIPVNMRYDPDFWIQRVQDALNDKTTTPTNSFWDESGDSYTFSAISGFTDTQLMSLTTHLLDFGGWHPGIEMGVGVYSSPNLAMTYSTGLKHTAQNVCGREAIHAVGARMMLEQECSTVQAVLDVMFQVTGTQWKTQMYSLQQIEQMQLQLNQGEFIYYPGYHLVVVTDDGTSEINGLSTPTFSANNGKAFLPPDDVHFLGLCATRTIAQYQQARSLPSTTVVTVIAPRELPQPPE